MRQKIVLLFSFFLLLAGTSIAQTKKSSSKSKPKTTTSKSKPSAKAAVPAPPAPICYPMREVADYYRISIGTERFKSDFEEIFELSRYDYSGYSLKTIIENRIRTKLGDAAADNLSLFGTASYLDIDFIKEDGKKAILDEICVLFSDYNAFEKYINTLKPKN